MEFDIVIPVGPNDSFIIKGMIEHTIKNIIGYRNIYLVSYDPNIKIDKCITINENIFPFNKESISEIIGYHERVGWYLQQLIKLYSGSTIPGILNNYLVIDSDTHFMNPTNFFNNGLPLYNYGIEYHIPYFDHMNKLHPILTKQTTHSGICHHMVFQQNILIDLFKLVEDYHKKEFFKVFLESINKNDILGSGASEYEIYFNYLHIYHKDLFIIRPLQWENRSNIINDNNLDYISCHHYMR